MKLTLQHDQVRSIDSLDSWIEESILALQPRLRIEEAKVRLAYRENESPGYGVSVHLVTPGPDVFAEGRDHTLRAAFQKAMAELGAQIGHRQLKKRRRLDGSLPKRIEKINS